MEIILRPNFFFLDFVDAKCISYIWLETKNDFYNNKFKIYLHCFRFKFQQKHFKNKKNTGSTTTTPPPTRSTKRALWFAGNFFKLKIFFQNSKKCVQKTKTIKIFNNFISQNQIFHFEIEKKKQVDHPLSIGTALPPRGFRLLLCEAYYAIWYVLIYSSKLC